VEPLGYHSNLNPLSVIDDESPTTKGRRVKGGFIRPLEPVQWESHQGLLDWNLRQRWDIHVHLEFGDRFPVRKVAVRDLFVLVYNQTFSLQAEMFSHEQLNFFFTGQGFRDEIIKCFLSRQKFSLLYNYSVLADRNVL
jgi:hypothetical protein